MRVRVALAVALASIFAANPAALRASQPDVAESVEPINEIEVLGQREIAKAVFRENLEELTAPLSVTEPTPRFFKPLCIEVAGITPEGAAFVADRIASTARKLGLENREPGCRTNALVMVVHEPSAIFENLISKELALVGVLPFRDVHVRRIRNEIRAREPVVSWNVLAATDINGGNAIDGVVMARSPVASRITSSIIRPKALSVVMYDAAQLRGATLGQLADHATLHLLGTPRRQIDFGRVRLSTVLSMFNDAPDVAPQELTDFDLAYLNGLYSLSTGAYQSAIPQAVVAAYAAQCEAQQSDCRIRLQN